MAHNQGQNQQGQQKRGQQPSPGQPMGGRRDDEAGHQGGGTDVHHQQSGTQGQSQMERDKAGKNKGGPA
ncbi:hypothetical protein GCM10011504_43810 [Siccirubricoccus deserti]|uniref:Uncharacterized protein n=1 Tax=Siccirubricoccus deserti TaxID=2013562 RepID=A0A9X0R2S3_9PROT|nr:hypothetical protein [Siccirubricoccus deserti]MBC4017768.1 hypothetical protein [Siccirubricoccus deserti]GGC60790.1 hypothetical protein GCM10011504_43810 [Siccirubricoccus deserti]